MHGVFVQPLTIRTGAGHLLLDLFVADNAPLFRIDQEHTARLQPAFFQDSLGRHVEHANLRGHDHQIVLGDIVTGRAQTVAIEHRADDFTVRECNRGRSVPWLHQAAVVCVKSPLPIVHALMVFPRLGDHHHHRVGQGASAQRQKFQAVVEFGGVTAVFLNDRKQFRQVGAKQLRSQHRLTRMHPVFVSAQGVDLTVVD